MSLISLLLSSKEVVLSLVVFGLILLLIVILALMPVLRGRWKKRMARQRAKQAEELARRKKSQINKQRALAAAKKRALEANMALIVPIDAGTDIVPEPIQASDIVPSAETTPEPETVEQAESENPSSLQNVLDSVFIDEEADLRFQNLLKGTEPVSAQALAELADNILGRFMASDEIKEGA